MGTGREVPRAARWIGLAGAAALALAVATAGGPADGADGKRLHYAYDAAGRLVRVGDGTGRFVQYDWDDAGNVVSRRTTRLWHLQVRKPARGAWVLSEEADGSVTGFGADDQRGFFAVTGTLDTSGPEAAGTLEIRDPDTEALLASFLLAGSKVVPDKATGDPLALVLKGSGADGSLVAKGARPEGAFRAFRGTYAGAKNQVKVGRTKASPGRVDFVEEGARPGVTLVEGGVTGTLVRDPKGGAYGELVYDGDRYLVSSKLKDGAKSVKAKTGKGAAEKLLLKVVR